MHFGEALRFSAFALWSNKMRTALTALGLVIGNASVILVVTILSTIWTFNDFSIVWLLTGGGPGHATDVFATYTYKLGFVTSRLGYGETVSVLLAPLLIAIIIVLSPLMLRGENE